MLMEELASTWIIVGLLVVICMLVLSFMKVLKWKITGWTSLVYIVSSIVFYYVAFPSTQQATKSKPQHDTPAFVLKNKADDDVDGDIYFETDSQGNYNVTLLGKQNSKITIKNEDPDDDDQKVMIHKRIKKGQTLKVPVHLDDDTILLHLVVKDSAGHKKKFEIGNESDAYNASSKAESESRAQEESDDSSSDTSDSSTAKYPHYNSNKKVAAAINDDFSSTGDDKYENTRVQYKDSIFYVSVPNSVTASPSSQQQSFFKTVVRTIHSYQKRPTGVIYFEDQQGNILAKTKALHNNEVKMK